MEHVQDARIGPISVVLLIRARVREAVAARRDKTSSTAETDDIKGRVLLDAAVGR